MISAEDRAGIVGALKHNIEVNAAVLGEPVNLNQAARPIRGAALKGRTLGL